MSPRAKDGLDCDSAMSLLWCCGGVDTVFWNTAAVATPVGEEEENQDDGAAAAAAAAAQEEDVQQEQEESEQDDDNDDYTLAQPDEPAGAAASADMNFSVEEEEEGIEIRPLLSCKETARELLHSITHLDSYREFIAFMNKCDDRCLTDLLELMLTSSDSKTATLQWMSDYCAVDPQKSHALQSHRILKLLTQMLLLSGGSSSLQHQEAAARVIQTLTTNPDMDAYFLSSQYSHELLDALAAVARGTAALPPPSLLPNAQRPQELHPPLPCCQTSNPASSLQLKSQDTHQCLGWILSPSSGHPNSDQPTPAAAHQPASILLLSPPRRTSPPLPPPLEKQSTPAQEQQPQNNNDWFFYYSPPPPPPTNADTTSTPASNHLSSPPPTISILSPPAQHHSVVPQPEGVPWPEPPQWNDDAKTSTQDPLRPSPLPQLPEWPPEHAAAPLPPIWHSAVAPHDSAASSSTPNFPELSPPRPLHPTAPSHEEGRRPWLFPRHQPQQSSWTCSVTRQARLHAMVALRNLSSGPDCNKAALGTWTPILDCCKTLMQDSSEVALRQHAAIALRNLSQLHTNHATLMSFPGLVHALGQAIRSCDEHGTLDDNYHVPVQACWALTHLSTAKEFKAQIYRSPGVMQALMVALHSNSKKLLIRACSVLSNLAIGYHNKWNMYYYPGFVPAIVNILNTNILHLSGTDNDYNHEEELELLSKACSILWSLAAEKQVQIPIVQEQPSVVFTLIRIVTSRHAMTPGPTRSKCWAALCLLAESTPNVMPLIRDGIVPPILDELQQLSQDVASSSWCVSCIMNLAQVEEAASILRHAGVVKLLEPMVIIVSSAKNGASLDYASLKAAMAVALVCKTDNMDDKALLMNKHYHLFRKMEATLLAMTTVLYNTLAGRGGPGYKYGVFSLPCVVACMAALTTGPTFWQEHVCMSIPLQTQLLQVLWDFAVHPVEGNTLVGGGPKDEASAKSAVQALHAMVLYQYEHVCLPEDLRPPLLRALHWTERRLAASKQDRSRNRDIRALSARMRQILQGFGPHLSAPSQQVQERDGTIGDATTQDDTEDRQESNSPHTVTAVALAIPITPASYNTKKRSAVAAMGSEDHFPHESPTCVIAVGLDSAVTPKKGRQNFCLGLQAPDNALS